MSQSVVLTITSDLNGRMKKILLSLANETSIGSFVMACAFLGIEREDAITLYNEYNN